MLSETKLIVTALGLYAAVVVIPGPNFALVSKLSIAGHRTTALAATLGLAVAATLYAVLAMSGMSLLLTRIGWLSGAVRIAGGCYLLFLGVSAWIPARPSRGDSDRTGRLGALPGFRMGVLVNLLNPKGIAFFVGLYAAAVPPGTTMWVKAVILGGGFFLEIAWYGLVTLTLSTGRARRIYTMHAGWIERAVGTMLAGFGIRLLTSDLSPV